MKYAHDLLTVFTLPTLDLSLLSMIFILFETKSTLKLTILVIYLVFVIAFVFIIVAAPVDVDPLPLPIVQNVDPLAIVPNHGGMNNFMGQMAHEVVHAIGGAIVQQAADALAAHVPMVGQAMVEAAVQAIVPGEPVWYTPGIPANHPAIMAWMIGGWEPCRYLRNLAEFNVQHEIVQG